MASTAAKSAHLSCIEVEAIARPEVARTLTSMLTESPSLTLTPLGTTARTLPGINTVQPEPIGQVEGARAIKHAAHALIKGLIRLALDTGRSWHEIGDALNLHGEAAGPEEPVAELAYDCALDYSTFAARHTCTWTCPTCQHLITDQGPFYELPVGEEGHADDCLRWSA